VKSPHSEVPFPALSLWELEHRLGIPEDLQEYNFYLVKSHATWMRAKMLEQLIYLMTLITYLQQVKFCLLASSIIFCLCVCSKWIN